MNRRTVLSSLAAASVGAFAGCVGGGCTSETTLRFVPVDTSEIASQTTSDVEDATEMMDALLERVFDEGDEAIVEVQRRGPLGWLTYVERDGRYYEITEKTVAEGPVTGPEYELSRERDAEIDVDASETLSFEELPRQDRWHIAEAADFSVEHLDGISFSISFVAGSLEGDEQGDSVLADGVDATAIETDDSVARLEHVGEGTEQVRRLRYAAEPVAESTAAFAEYVLERRGAAAFDPNDEVQQLLAETRDADGRLRICHHERDDADVDEETRERRLDAVDDLERDLAALESGGRDLGDGETDADADGGTENGDDEDGDGDGDGTADPPVPLESLEYVRYEGDWYRIRITESVV